jgi:hypothetical protein
MDRNSFTFVSVLALGLFSAACSGNDGEISVEPANVPLTEKGNDSLFTVSVVKSSDDGYATDSFKVRVTPDGKDAIDVFCTLNDVNTNQKLDKGDKLNCSEPAENKLDATLAGKEVKVELFAKVDDEEERIGDATWTPPK